MREIIKLALILLLITSVAAVVLGLSNSVTEEVIEEVEAQLSNEARTGACPNAETFKPIDEEVFNQIIESNDKVMEVFAGYAGDEMVGYAIKTATPGYGANVEVITGISLDGKLTGIQVVKHQETPGLGANITGKGFQNQYTGKSAETNISVVKVPPKDNEIQALSGATISSDAVTDGVNIAIDVFKNILSK